jgi:hypothetical protein
MTNSCPDVAGEHFDWKLGGRAVTIGGGSGINEQGGLAEAAVGKARLCCAPTQVLSAGQLQCLCSPVVIALVQSQQREAERQL